MNKFTTEERGFEWMKENITRWDKAGGGCAALVDEVLNDDYLPDQDFNLGCIRAYVERED